MEYAQEVWEKMKMKNMGDYHDCYLKQDVLGLADVMEAFRKVCRKEYNLDPPWFYTTQALAWDAVLKNSKVTLELLTDQDMLLCFERGIRGGISAIFHRKAEANNKYMDDFDESKPSVFIPYWDANALYSWAMLHPLPIGEFQWMSEKELREWENIPCTIEVDIDIPKELHEKFKDFPPLPEKVSINGGVPKLVLNLWDRREMVIHSKALKQAIELGCQLVKVKKGIKYKEEAWMKSYT